MFSQSLESQRDFIMFKHGNHWKWSATYAHTLQWITHANTHENWADSYCHSGNTGKSHNPYIWHLFSDLSVSCCNNLFIYFLILSLVITGIIECVVNTRFFETRETSACTSRLASCLISSVVVKSSCPYLSGLCSSGISACFFLKSSNKINAFTRAISRSAVTVIISARPPLPPRPPHLKYHMAFHCLKTHQNSFSPNIRSHCVHWTQTKSKMVATWNMLHQWRICVA